MQHLLRRFSTCLLLAACSSVLFADGLEEGWLNPPREARLRAYWWWLNGNVTKTAITRDLEEMSAKGFGGALICDADGASQDGNDRVPHGPDFFSPAWRDLFKHALVEAERLGLEMSLNIQSGWNLGGPMVTAEDAAKKLVWSEARVQGPAQVEQTLPQPRSRDGFYRDLFVVAYPLKAAREQDKVFLGVTASSARKEHREANAVDGSAESFWVSSGVEPGEGPTAQRPEWLQLDFANPVAVHRLTMQGRPGYGPRDCELQASQDGKTFRPVKKFSAPADRAVNLEFDEVTARHFRLLMLSSFDPRFPESPRNVQVAEVRLSGKTGSWPQGMKRPIQNWEQKAMHRALHFSAPDTTPLLVDLPPEPGEEDALIADVVDLTARVSLDGVLRWDVPEGTWQVLRFGCTIGDHSRVSTSSDGWKGYALDVLDAGAFQRYWDAVVEPLIADAGPRAGTTLKYLHTDSWEVEAINWTPTLREEFRKRRGYDFLPYLPVITGRIVESRPVSNRFLNDFRKTLGDLAIDNHYRPFREGAHRHGLLIHPESGGPHAVPVDAQRCLGFNDVPMSEFWAWSWRHRVGDSNRFFVKQPASAAHTYGRRFVAAEGFTTIGPHWQETLWDNLKPSFDRALCEGLNRLVWHAFTCSPAEMGLPGQEYFAGTHFNPNSTWWSRSGPFLAYINRCQWMLHQGLFVADACYYYGDHVPNFAQLKRSDPAGVLPGFDYDVATEEVVLTRMSVREGRIVLPDGMSYRLLVLPDRTRISLAVLRKLKALVDAGATVIGPKPESGMGLTDHPKCDQEVAELAAGLWGDRPSANGPGRVISDRTAREVLSADGVKPDFEFTGADPLTTLDYIHRRDEAVEIYFVANRSNRFEQALCTFRVTGKQPELWNPVTGERRDAAVWSQADGRSAVPLEFTPYGSWFVVFRKAAPPPASVAGRRNVPSLTPAHEITGPWTVQFDPAWGGPASVPFPELVSWTKRPEDGIKFYSGTATYRQTFDLSEAQIPNLETAIHLDLGDVKQLAEVRLNGKNLGVLWTFPFRADVTGLLQRTGNRLEIDVVNFWPNRVIGDASLPPDQRRTKTNIRKLTKDTPLMESGLLGPVQLLIEASAKETEATPPREIIPAKAPGAAVDPETMQRIYDEVKTPHKYGIVIRGTAEEKVDCPNVFRHGEKWFMIFIAFDGKGYETRLAQSEDLLHWKILGPILRRGTGGWDSEQAAAGVALIDDRWDGTWELQQHEGRYWLSYLGGRLQGYETPPLSVGLAWTKDPASTTEWRRLPENPVLTPAQVDARPFERDTLFKSHILRDERETLGWPFVMFYNARQKGPGVERIGMAVSRDLRTWHRYGAGPVIDHGDTRGISGDPQIVRIGDVWVMFYFGAFWRPGAFDTFACSRDLVTWTKWTGPDLIAPSEPWDKTYAHKPWVIRHKGVVYHFYCAVGDQGRVIALATSKDLRKAQREDAGVSSAGAD